MFHKECIVKDINEVLKYGREFLIDNNIDPREARLLLAYSMGIDVDNLIKYSECDEKQYQAFIDVLNRRSKCEPFAYIKGEKEFMKLHFKVNKHTLIPREDTEILVQKAIEIINSYYEANKVVSINKKQNSKMRILDMCTGSGCIAISIAKYVSRCVVDAVDISKEALQLATQNAKINEVKVKFIKSNLFEKVDNVNKYDMIISNPPYIESDTINELQAEVKYEPKIALDGGKDGLYFYKKIASESKKYLKLDGVLLFEIGYNQAQSVTNILKENDYKNIEVIKDLSSNDRVVLGYN